MESDVDVDNKRRTMEWDSDWDLLQAILRDLNLSITVRICRMFTSTDVVLDNVLWDRVGEVL